MKIERKENSELVEFGSLKCGDVCEIDDFGIWIKTERKNEVGLKNVTCLNLTNGEFGLVEDNRLVKPYPNAKLVLGD